MGTGRGERKIARNPAGSFKESANLFIEERCVTFITENRKLRAISI